MIYLDHNATSPSSGEHLSRVFHALARGLGNPSSPHVAGREGSVALTQARREVAKATGFDVADVVFVSGGTEANNLGTAGVLAEAEANRAGGAAPSREGVAGTPAVFHAVTSAIEHPSVLEPLRALERAGRLELTVLPVDASGLVSVEQVFAALKPHTRLLTLMAANNETGVCLPVRAVGDALHAARWTKETSAKEPAVHVPCSHVPQATLRALHFHVDGVQAFGKLPSAEWISEGVDSVSLCAHKVGGLPGIGALCLRRGRRYVPAFRGGAQEKNRRAGTENLAGIVSLGMVAADINSPQWWNRVGAVREKMEALRAGLALLPQVRIHTPAQGILPNTLNFSVVEKRLRGEDVLMELDMRGVCASSGSACSSGANLPSKVLVALGCSDREARDAVRLSLGMGTTSAEVEQALGLLRAVLSRP